MLVLKTRQIWKVRHLAPPKKHHLPIVGDHLALNGWPFPFKTWYNLGGFLFGEGKQPLWPCLVWRMLQNSLSWNPWTTSFWSKSIFEPSSIYPTSKTFREPMQSCKKHNFWTIASQSPRRALLIEQPSAVAVTGFWSWLKRHPEERLQSNFFLGKNSCERFAHLRISVSYGKKVMIKLNFFTLLWS